MKKSNMDLKISNRTVKYIEYEDLILIRLTFGINITRGGNPAKVIILNIRVI